jgi:ABC-2 type transport system ATP-binding protein
VEEGPVAAVADVRGLSVGYRDRAVLQDLSLTLGREGTTLLGVNGAGKTTLLRTLAGDLTARSGQISLFGAVVSASRPEALLRRTGYLPQEVELPGRMQVRDVVAYTAWLKKVPRGQVRPAVTRWLERVGLADRARDRVATLSGGMRRRLSVACALVHDPDLVLLDEPTVGLDPEQRVALRRLLAGLAAERCVLVSTHQLADVEHLGRRLLVLDGGRIVFDGDAAGLAACDDGAGAGDTPLERGFAAVIGSR